MKRRPERVLEKTTRFLKWVFWDELLGGVRDGWIAVGAVAIIMAFLIILYAPIPTLPLPHERYQAAYDDCIAAATLTAAQCHDIALAVI